MQNEIRIGLIGTRFMGKAHSNAFINAPLFFKLPLKPVLQCACGQNQKYLEEFSGRFGWKAFETDYLKLIKRDDIDLVDIATSNDHHMPAALAAAKTGKHILCEKPLARNAGEAVRMYEAAMNAGIQHSIMFNYRRVPAIMLAKKLIEEGKLGRVFHFNAVYYQDWLVDPDFPFTWRHNTESAGSGVHGDLNSHLVDLARYLLGEFEAVCGAEETFVKERKQAQNNTMVSVTVDDAATFLARFRNGAMGNFFASRFATGRKNHQRIEIFGSEGSLVFNLERLNELEFYDRNLENDRMGFRRILVTEALHPYMEAWWPAGHIIGWEHTFIHHVSDFIHAIANKKPMHPDFEDGYKCQLVLDAVKKSIDHRKWMDITN